MLASSKKELRKLLRASRNRYSLKRLKKSKPNRASRTSNKPLKNLCKIMQSSRKWSKKSSRWKSSSPKNLSTSLQATDLNSKLLSK